VWTPKCGLEILRRLRAVIKRASRSWNHRSSPERDRSAVYLCDGAVWVNVRFSPTMVFLDCHGADIRVRRACRMRPVAPHSKADRGSRRRGERGATAGTSDAAGTRGRLLDGRLPTGCLETGGDPGQAEGCQPRQHPASRASAGGQAPGTSRRSPPVRSRSPGRKMRLPSCPRPATPSR
jgi:hypothetical protein